MASSCPLPTATNSSFELQASNLPGLPSSRCRARLAYWNVTMMSEGENASLSDVEAAIEARLFTWSEEPKMTRQEPASSAPKKDKSKKRKKRKRSSTPSEEVEGELKRSSDEHSTAALLQAAKSAGADASRRALEATLVRRRSPENLKMPNGKGLCPSSSAPIVVVDNSSTATDIQRVLGKQGSIARPGHGPMRDGPEVESGSAMAFVESHRREVGELGAAALAKKDRRAYEERKRLDQGCRRLKQQKMPLPMLLGMRKKQRAREAKAKELALASGMLIRSKRKNK